MIIDGRKLAREILVRTKMRVKALARPPHIIAIVTDETPATKLFLAVKSRRASDAGCILKIRYAETNIHKNTLQQEIVDIVKTSGETADAVIVQLPLPSGIDAKIVRDAIPVSKDADVLSSAARAKFKMMDLRNPSLLPPVVGAVREIFIQTNVDARGKKTVVIGDGWLVGNPCAVWLKQQGAEVTVLTLESGDLRNCATPGVAQLRDADIIVSGAGSPHLIKPEMLKQDVVLIDAGTSESSGEVVGDADPSCADKCSIFTPVPGGIGPLAVAKLFENAVTLAKGAMNT